MTEFENRSLNDYSVRPSTPSVRRHVILWAPTADNKPAGFVGNDTNRGFRVYTTRRTDYHYYREGPGYAMSDQLLAECKQYDVSRVLVHTKDEGDVYEYPLRAYFDEDTFEHIPVEDLMDPMDTQRYVPDDERMNEWEGYADQMFHSSFSNAMDRITAKRGWGSDG